MNRKNLLHKVTHWEYWPFFCIYFSVIIYHLYLSLRARSFFFFTASNPAIETGGMLGESKSAILEKIPAEYVAKFIKVSPHISFAALKYTFEKNTLTYPLIAKPDVGERGRDVVKIEKEAALLAYHTQLTDDYILQEYIDFPVELGVFYCRYPSQTTGNISSIVKKNFLTVTGNGHETLAQLVDNYPRAAFVKPHLEQKFSAIWHTFVPNGHTLALEVVGNHCRGTMFLDACELINDSLIDVFDRISMQIEGFYYGRYDLRCASIDDLYKGKNIKIVELNGCGAEPAHIYQPGYSFWKGQKVLLNHHKILFTISMMNHQNGVPFYSLAEIKNRYQAYKQKMRALAAVDLC